MPGSIYYYRRGMSLIELLVVIAILGLLAVTVLPNLANTGAKRSIRETARQFSGFIAAAQSTAISSRAGSGIWLDPLPNPVTGGDGLLHRVVIDLSRASIPVPYAGETSNAVVRFTVGSGNGALEFKPDDTPEPSFYLPKALLNSTNLYIRFAGAPTLFRLNGLSLTVSRDVLRGQTEENSPWPVMAPDSPGVPYEVFLPASRSPIESLTLGGGAVIDLTWTILGQTGTTWPPGSDLSPSMPVQVLYDATGAPSMVVKNAGPGQPILDPICFLVTSLEAIQEGTCFTKAGSYWVAIDPRGGIPRVAEVKLRTGGVPGDPAALRESQEYVFRSALQVGR